MMFDRLRCSTLGVEMSTVPAGYTVTHCERSRLPELFSFRARVWVEEGADPHAFSDGAWTDERDSARMHWVALHRDAIVGAASLSVHPSISHVEEAEVYGAVPYPSLGLIAAPARVVVDKDHRGRGIADALLELQDRAAIDAGAVFGVRQASPAMKKLLLRHGWHDHGPAPHDPRFPHVQFSVMSRSYGEPA